MASELIRQTWCDIHLKQEKVQVPGIEGYVRVHWQEGSVIKQLDPCQEHIDKGITLDDVMEYGFTPASTKFQPRRAPARTGTRRIVPPNAPSVKASDEEKKSFAAETGRLMIECAFCHLRFVSRAITQKAIDEGRHGSGWALHRKMHIEAGIDPDYLRVIVVEP